MIRRGHGRAEIAGAVAIAITPAGVPQRIEALGGEELEFYCLCTPRFTPKAYEGLEDT